MAVGKRFASDDEVLARLRRLEHSVSALQKARSDVAAATAGLVPHSLLGVEHAATVPSPPVLGGMICGNVTPEWEQLVGNITTIKKFLTQLGTGAASAAPIWETLDQASVAGLTTFAFELDGADDWEPITGTPNEYEWELDGADDIMPTDETSPMLE